MPEVIEDFFLSAAPMTGLAPKPAKTDSKVFKLGRIPRNLWPTGERLEPRFGKLGREYGNIVFDKELLKQDATLEWVTPEHPLFEAVSEDVSAQVQEQLKRGAVFFDLQTRVPYRLDVFSSSIRDGRGNVITRRLFVVQATMDGQLAIKQPTVFLDLFAAATCSCSEDGALPDGNQLGCCWSKRSSVAAQARNQREKEVSIVRAISN